MYHIQSGSKFGIASRNMQKTILQMGDPGALQDEVDDTQEPFSQYKTLWTVVSFRKWSQAGTRSSSMKVKKKKKNNLQKPQR